MATLIEFNEIQDKEKTPKIYLSNSVDSVILFFPPSAFWRRKIAKKKWTQSWHLWKVLIVRTSGHPQSIVWASAADEKHQIMVKNSKARIKEVEFSIYLYISDTIFIKCYKKQGAWYIYRYLIQYSYKCYKKQGAWYIYIFMIQYS